MTSMQTHLLSYSYREIHQLEEFLRSRKPFAELCAPEGFGKEMLVRAVTEKLQRQFPDMSFPMAWVQKSDDVTMVEIRDVENSTQELQQLTHRLLSSNKPHCLVLLDSQNLHKDQLQRICDVNLKKVQLLFITTSSLDLPSRALHQIQELGLGLVPKHQYSLWVQSIHNLNQEHLKTLHEATFGHRGLTLRVLDQLSIDPQSEEILSLAKAALQDFSCTEETKANSPGVLHSKPGEDCEDETTKALELFNRRDFTALNANAKQCTFNNFYLLFEYWLRGFAQTSDFSNEVNSFQEKEDCPAVLRDLANSLGDIESMDLKSLESLLERARELIPSSLLFRLQLHWAICNEDSEQIALAHRSLEFHQCETFQEQLLLHWMQLDAFVLSSRSEKILETLSQIDESVKDESPGVLRALAYYQALHALLKGDRESLIQTLNPFCETKLVDLNDPLSIKMFQLLGTACLESSNVVIPENVHRVFANSVPERFREIFEFEGTYLNFLQSCVLGEVEQAQNWIHALSRLETAVPYSMGFRVFYSGYLVQKISNPWSITSFEIPAPRNQQAIDFLWVQRHLSRLEEHFDHCACVNGNWNAVSGNTLRELREGFQDYDLFFDFTRNVFWETESKSLGLEKSRVSQLLFLILAFSRESRFELSQLFEAAYEKDYEPELDEPTIRVAMNRMKKRIEPQKDKYIAVGISDGKYHLRSQTRYLILLPDTEISHFRDLMERVRT